LKKRPERPAVDITRSQIRELNEPARDKPKFPPGTDD
jgi:hypothetical protein